jgi:hypothetical protein
MAYWIKSAAISGLVGLLIMAALHFIGSSYLWELCFWPSQFGGIGTDEVHWVPEVIIQFSIYALFGLGIAFVSRLVARKA